MGDRIETLQQMKRAGYKLRNSSKCKACRRAIDWWTTTNNKLVAFDPATEDENAVVKTHISTCPNRNQIVSKADAARNKAMDRTRQAAELLERTGARAIVALYQEGPVLAWANDITGEDLRDECITAANKLRWQVFTKGGQIR